ncbi:MAG: hemerythrin family protein [Candidatus Brocadiaceae bacterium]|nr:hemerythrin family protein [Candidatus Brocadiaceae bacterium]
MFEWNEKYSVNISIIDKEHKRLIRIINEAIVAKQHHSDLEEISKLLKELTMYALKHFSTEETYMAKFNYPEFQNHKNEHHDFSNKMITYCNKVIEGEYQIANEIIEYLKRWLVNHIQVTDKKYMACFKKNGL